MNQHITDWKEEKRAEFKKKMSESYAKGGFLTTDLDSSWQCDEDVMLSWFLSQLPSLLTLLEGEVGEPKEYESFGKLSFEKHDGVNQECQRVMKILSDAKSSLT